MTVLAGGYVTLDGVNDVYVTVYGSIKLSQPSTPAITKGLNSYSYSSPIYAVYGSIVGAVNVVESDWQDIVPLNS